MHKQSSVIGGMVLILVGLFFLAFQFLPAELTRFLDMRAQWPLILVAVGGIFLAAAFLSQPPLAIPGMVLGGIGLLLYYQNLTGNWASWAYAWTLIPGFVGLGILLEQSLQGNAKRGFRKGGKLLIMSLGLFIAFSLLFTGLRGLLWPVVMIGLGFILLIRNMGRRR
ncbi:MAG: hypothetical protein KJ063_20615 [Anaerolineae bacterium]|nr:hypothetical protein [Anaerolineae bacterium]